MERRNDVAIGWPKLGVLWDLAKVEGSPRKSRWVSTFRSHRLSVQESKVRQVLTS